MYQYSQSMYSLYAGNDCKFFKNTEFANNEDQLYIPETILDFL